MPTSGSGRRASSRTALTQLAAATVAIVAFVVSAWRSEALRGLLDRLDRHMVAGAYVALAALVCGSLITSIRPVAWSAGARLRRAVAPVVVPAGLAVSTWVFATPVFAAWHRGRAFSMIGGAVPWGDAHLYAGGAERLLFFGHLDAYNSRRPFNAVYLAVRLAVGGLDLRVAVLIGVLLLGLVTFVAARTVARDLGAMAGCALFVGVFGFIHYYLPTTLSETFGATLGMLAFAAVWNAARRRNVWLALGGVFLIAIALGARAGVFTLSVMMGLWFARHLRARGLLDVRVLAASALAVVAGVGLTFVTVAALGGDTGNTFGNGGFLLYGMAKGHPAWDTVDVSWVRVFTDHPEIIAMSDGQRNRFVNSLAKHEILAHKARFLGATVKGTQNYLTIAKRVILAPWSVRQHRALMLLAAVAIVAALALRVRFRRGQRAGWDLALFAAAIVSVPALASITPGLVPPRWLGPAVAALAFLGFIVIGTRSLPLTFPGELTVVAFLAVMLSLPFIGTDSVRVFADAIGFMALPLILAVVLVGQVGPVVRPDRIEGAQQLVPLTSGSWEKPSASGSLPLVLGGALIASMAVGIPVAMAAVHLPAAPPRQCPDGRAAQPLIGGVGVRIVAGRGGGSGGVDELGLDAFARQASSFAPVPYNHLARIAGPATLIGGLTMGGVDRFAILDGLVSAPRSSVRYLCGQIEEDPLTTAVFSILSNPADVFRGVPLGDPTG